jgi:hypothetical protein
MLRLRGGSLGMLRGGDLGSGQPSSALFMVSSEHLRILNLCQKILKDWHTVRRQ